MNKLLFSIIVLTVSEYCFSQTIGISEARSKAIGTQVTISGIVLNGSELGLIRYIQDETAGIGVYSSGFSSATTGDSVVVTGTLKDYYNLFELDPVQSHTIINSGNTLPEAKVLSFSDGYSEIYESMLVEFRNIRFSTSGIFSGNTNYYIKHNGNEEQVRISGGTNIVGTAIPSDEINIKGIMSQYQSSYQLMTRSLADFIFKSGPVINSRLIPIEINKNSLTLNFTTEGPGSTILAYGKTKSLELGTISDTAKTTNHTTTISNLEPATFYYVKAASTDMSNDTSQTIIHYFSTASYSSGKIIVYFNNDVDHSYSNTVNAIFLDRTVDDTLVAYINRAQFSIDMAIYNINNQSLSANISIALNNAKSRGLTIRVIGDGSTANMGLNELDGSINILKSPQSSSYKIMHNKFFIFDADSPNPNDPIIWTGSTNLTTNQIHIDPNNVIIIQDQALAQAYKLEFEEMWGSTTENHSVLNSRFGKYKEDNTPHFFNVDGKLIELYFSPSDYVNSKIISAINSADHSIYFATFVFTRSEIANPIIDKYQNGVYAAGIFGDISGFNSQAYDILQPVLDTNVIAYSGANIFHHKYAIIDPTDYLNDPLVITGSHNWSKSANESNDENTLIIHDDTIANIYFQEWAKRFEEQGGTVYYNFNSIKEARRKNQAYMYGYLANKRVFIEIYSATNENVTVILYDLNGKILFNRNYFISQGRNNIEILPERISQGIYILKVVNNKLNLYSKIISSE